MKTPGYLEPSLLQQIAEAICRVRYGSIHITIHDARVVQIERIEKIRLSMEAHLRAGGIDEKSATDQVSGGIRSKQANIG